MEGGTLPWREDHPRLREEQREERELDMRTVPCEMRHMHIKPNMGPHGEMIYFLLRKVTVYFGKYA